MLINTPHKKDFGEVANHALHTSWSTIIDIMVHSPDRTLEKRDAKSNYNEKYKKSVRPALAACIASVTQSVEFFLKGRICDISPYLLISSDVKGWPKGSDVKNVDYTEFKTVDAQDLLKIHETMCENSRQLGPKFKDWYLDLRKKRNKIMHTVDKGAEYAPFDILILILECHEYFYGTNKWTIARRLFIKNYALNGLIYNEGDNDGVVNEILLHELSVLFENIKPAQAKRFFCFNKKDRASKCPSCLIPIHKYYSDCKQTDMLINTLQKVDNEDYMKCFVCRDTAKYSGNCNDNECYGETISLSSGECLWCKAFN